MPGPVRHQVQAYWDGTTAPTAVDDSSPASSTSDSSVDPDDAHSFERIERPQSRSGNLPTNTGRDVEPTAAPPFATTAAFPHPSAEVRRVDSVLSATEQRPRVSFKTASPPPAVRSGAGGGELETGLPAHHTKLIVSDEDSENTLFPADEDDGDDGSDGFYSSLDNEDSFVRHELAAAKADPTDRDPTDPQSESDWETDSSGGMSETGTDPEELQRASSWYPPARSFVLMWPLLHSSQQPQAAMQLPFGKISPHSLSPAGRLWSSFAASYWSRKSTTARRRAATTVRR